MILIIIQRLIYRFVQFAIFSFAWLIMLNELPNLQLIHIKHLSIVILP